MQADQKSAALELTLKLCTEFEGFSEKPYLCPAGVHTIGYGLTHYSGGKKVTMQDAPISKEKALSETRYLLAGFQESVLQCCPAIKSTGLLAACTDLAYNIGANAFGSSTLRKVVNEGGSNDDIAAQFRRWNKGGGKVLAGLTRRREAEIAII